MSTRNPRDRPDIVAAIRGGDHSLGMEGEGDPRTSSREQAVLWKGIYEQVLAIEEAVLARVQELMTGRSPVVRREIELTNVPVVVAQMERFRVRLRYWASRADATGPRS